MNEADLRGIRASLDDYADRSVDQRDELPTRVFVNHTRDLLVEVDRLRAGLRRMASEDWRGNEPGHVRAARALLDEGDSR